MKSTIDARNVLSDVQAVVFDLDGTLYDKRGLAKRMVRRLWWCLPLMLTDRLAKGRVWRWIVSTRWHRKMYLKTMTELIEKHCPRREEVIELAQTAHRMGLKTAIYSDYGAVEEKLEALKVDTENFDLLITAPELGGLKPSKECVNPETTLFVGDRDEKDGAAARSVGAKFLWVNGEWRLANGK